ncbi:hypothetical protein JD844_010916 [Phrynosoma platyrhinos]|uniref:Grh/CP2 DB domain-containing protein n=1 Tax=Phrynosoma platyrhinos TaxID=52577 RepID=A0ABQ7THP5_PHRPL|nr:hypothetical protein JD844_010916 [Phrynosoma platyrhinos]
MKIKVRLIKTIILLTRLSCSDVLALPIFKQEESNLPPDNENKILPFQYVLCAATSPAVKLHDETLTYLNQGELHFCGLNAGVYLEWCSMIAGFSIQNISSWKAGGGTGQGTGYWILVSDVYKSEIV